MINYALVIEPLNDEDGGGYIGFFPDLPGCMSDGETPQEAAVNAQDALRCWLEAQIERGAPIPEPGEAHREFIEFVKATDAELEKLSTELEAARSRVEQLERARPTGWYTRSARVSSVRKPSGKTYAVAL